jgi:hypothetical protein
MSQKAFPMRLAGLLVAFVLVAGAWSAAQARIHSLSGNARFQIGDGLPIPIAFTPPPPNGKVEAIGGATIRLHGVHAATNPARVTIDPFQLTFDGPPIRIAFFTGPVFQVKTDITLRWPKEKISFRALGRTGPPIVTFCGKPPSTTIVKAGANPACAAGPANTGLLRYTATLHQFGGPAQGLLGGVADVALRGGSPAPCSGGPGCVVAFFNAGPASMAAVGAMFGFINVSVPTAPSPGAFFANVGPAGTVLTLLTPLGPGLSNGGTSWGGPWTTGMLTASAPTAGPPEKFTLTGSDMRTVGSTGPSNEGGAGSLSLVAGGFSQRAISGPNANRGWLNFVIGSKLSHIPVLPTYGVAALVGLTVLSGAYALRRRRNQ